ncbi:hypothetical protein M885DRAFT_526039 [Pelagophyceae sp. CCMP2097]|nr:hypothetical protein M885DRAFT_526039 [Pelagophyceae sp. CCMP2097]
MSQLQRNKPLCWNTTGTLNRDGRAAPHRRVDAMLPHCAVDRQRLFERRLEAPLRRRASLPAALCFSPRAAPAAASTPDDQLERLLRECVSPGAAPSSANDALGASRGRNVCQAPPPDPRPRRSASPSPAAPPAVNAAAGFAGRAGHDCTVARQTAEERRGTGDDVDGGGGGDEILSTLVQRMRLALDPQSDESPKDALVRRPAKALERSDARTTPLTRGLCELSARGDAASSSGLGSAALALTADPAEDADGPGAGGGRALHWLDKALANLADVLPSGDGRTAASARLGADDDSSSADEDAHATPPGDAAGTWWRPLQKFTL